MPMFYTWRRYVVGWIIIFIGSMPQKIREHWEKLKRSREQRKIKGEQKKNEEGARMEKYKGAGSKGENLKGTGSKDAP